MNNSVIIKGNKSGMTVILDRDMSFEKLLEDIADKFKETAKFWGNAQMAVIFEGRTLTTEEERKILDVITENSDLEIICIIDKDEEKELRYNQALKDRLNELSAQTGQFYKGTLRSGQVLESEGSIIVLGDINPGGKVIAKGNIVVLGTLKGTAWAGMSGNDSAFVVALDMLPMQIRIGDLFARSADNKNNVAVKGPMISYVEEGNIYNEPLSKEVINDIKFL